LGEQSIKGQYSDITFGGNPKLKFRLAQTAELGAFSANAALNHTSPLEDSDAANGLPVGSALLAAYDTVDLSAGIDLEKLLRTRRANINGLKFSIGVNNLFDKKTPFVKLLNSVDTAGTYDLRERFFYAALNVNF
jgi:outer membrane receptor protein involved in Fe transport